MKTQRSRMYLSAAVMALAIVVTGTTRATDRVWPPSQVMSQLERVKISSDLDFSDWQLLQDRYLERPVVGWGPPITLEASDLAKSALSVIREMSGTHSKFELLTQTNARGLARFYFRETRQDLPVFGGGVSFSVNSGQALSRWTLRSHDKFPTREAHLLDVTSAAKLLGPNQSGADWPVKWSISGWYPDYEIRQLLPALWIRLEGELPHERWEGIVEASSGEVLLEWPGIHTDVVSGSVSGPYWQPYEQSDVQISPHRHELIFVNGNMDTTDSNGLFQRESGNHAELVAELRGPYVDVDNEDRPEDAQLALTVNAPFSPVSMTWSTAEATGPELNLYFHTQFIHDWYKILDPEYNALDYPMPAVCNVGNAYDNAYWNGYGTYYGSGSTYNDFAMYSDVIYHEYTHGVTDGIYPEGMLPYIDQPGAMNEAWSDYFACTINGDPLMGDYLQGGNPHSFFRNLESTMVFPDNWVGEVHGDSPFISAPLWTIRTAMGTEFADALAHYARYGLAETFFDYLVSVLETDDNDGDLSNGTPNGELIYSAFGDHGIGPGDDPNFVLENISYVADGTLGSLGDGDRFVEPGERVSLTFVLRNDALLFPPPATDVQVAVISDDPSAIVSNSPQSIVTLPAGQSFTPQPFLIQYAADAADHWTALRIHVSSGGSPSTLEDTVAFTIGTPRMLIVADDASSNVERFVTQAVRGQGRIYDLIELSNSDMLSADRLPGYGVVLWLSGNAEGNVLQTPDQNLLQTYLAAGNKIVLSGQNIADALDGGTFAENTLQVDVINDSLLSNAVTAEGAPFVDGDWFLITGSGGAMNQRTPSTFLPLGNSRAIAHYGRGEAGDVAAVEFANGNGLLFGFGIEAVSGLAGSSSLLEMLEQIYAWAGPLLTVPEIEHPAVLPANLEISGAFPNPFNASVEISYSLGSGNSGLITIHDILGRKIDSIPLSTQAGVVSWKPATASGLYFARIESNGQFSAATKLMLMR